MPINCIHVSGNLGIELYGLDKGFTLGQHLDESEWSLTYVRVDHAIDIIKALGEGTKLIKVNKKTQGPCTSLIYLKVGLDTIAFSA